MDIRIIIRIHDCVKNGCTGSPKDFSEKLGVSERTLYNYIAFMKVDLKDPIVFNGNKRCYEDVGEHKLCFVEFSSIYKNP
jgi:hypothetical protein